VLACYVTVSGCTVFDWIPTSSLRQDHQCRNLLRGMYSCSLRVTIASLVKVPVAHSGRAHANPCVWCDQWGAGTRLPNAMYVVRGYRSYTHHARCRFARRSVGMFVQPLVAGDELSRSCLETYSAIAREPTRDLLSVQRQTFQALDVEQRYAEPFRKEALSTTIIACRLPRTYGYFS
jgi:hypothetical protein